MAVIKINNAEIDLKLTETVGEKIAHECEMFTNIMNKSKDTDEITDDNLQAFAEKRFKTYQDFLYKTIGRQNTLAIVGDNRELTLKEIDDITAEVCRELLRVLPKQDNQPKFMFK